MVLPHPAGFYGHLRYPAFLVNLQKMKTPFHFEVLKKSCKQYEQFHRHLVLVWHLYLCSKCKMTSQNGFSSEREKENMPRCGPFHLADLLLLLKS